MFDPQKGPILFADSREGSSITVCEYFSPVDCGGKDPWLKLFSERSIIRFSIMKTDHDANQNPIHVVTKSNMKVMDCERLIDKTKLLSQKMTMSSVSSTESSQEGASSKSNNVRFQFGPFAGKTAAEAVECDREEALKQRDYLNANAAKYPKNKVLVDALDEALNGNVGSQESSSTQTPSLPPFVLYECRDKEGREVTKYIKNDKLPGTDSIRWYSLNIIANPDNGKVTINHYNFFAPMKPMANGLTPADMSKKSNDVHQSWTVDWNTFEDFVRILEWDINECVREWHGFYRKKAIESMQQQQTNS